MATTTKARAKTPAEIPAETAAAQQSSYEPAFPLDRIHVHPKNPRHKAIADTELIDSIREQGLIHDLVLAPHPEIDGDGILVDGHRRFDALTKAGFSYAPVKFRLDLVDEASQLAAMLATIRREDLSPIEEAEGFDVLAELGWTVDQIAAATGRSKTTVTARRKLTRLKPTFQEQVGAGQVTIDHAMTLATLPVKEQERLERHVGKHDFVYELNRSKDRARRQAEVDKQTTALKKAGAPEQKMPSGTYYTLLNDADHGMTPLDRFPLALRDQEKHANCLAWINTGTAQYPGITLVCTNYGKHDDEISRHQAEAAAKRSAEEKAADEREAARRAASEAERAALEEARAARKVAALMRADAAIEATGKLTTPPAVLVPAIKAMVLCYLDQFSINAEVFNEIAKVPADLAAPDGVTHEYRQTIAGMAPADLWRAFIATALAGLEDTIGFDLDHSELTYDELGPIYAEHLAVLQQAGHELTPPDRELLALVHGDDAAVA